MKNTAAFIPILFLVFSCQPPDALMDKPYTYDELTQGICQLRLYCVEFEDELYFIERGFVFRFDKTNATKEYAGGYDATEIVGYRGSVVALKGDGTVHILQARDEGRQDTWIEIAEAVGGIEANGAALVALDNNVEDLLLFVDHTGEPIVFEPKLDDYRQRPIVRSVPSVSKRRIVFERISFSNIYSLGKNERGDIVVTHIDTDGVSSAILIPHIISFAEEPPYNEL